MMTDQGHLHDNNILEETQHLSAKIWFFAAIQFFAAFVFSIVLRFAFLEPDISLSVYAACAGIISLAFFLLSVFFARGMFLSIVFTAFYTLGISLGLFDQFSGVLFFVAAVVFLFLVAANYAGRKELEESLVVRFWKVGKVVMPKAILAVSIFIAGIYYSLHAGSAFDSIFITESTFETLLLPIQAPIKKIIPEFDVNITVSQFLTKIAQSKINESKELSILPQSAKNKLIGDTVKMMEDQIQGFSGEKPNPQSKVPQAMYDIIKANLKSLGDGAKNGIILLTAFFFLLFIIGFTWPIRLVATGLAFLLYELLLALGFAVILHEGRSKEIVAVK